MDIDSPPVVVSRVAAGSMTTEMSQEMLRWSSGPQADGEPVSPSTTPRISSTGASTPRRRAGIRSIVPIALGDQLYKLITAPKRFVRFPGAGHNELAAYGALEAAKQFLSEPVQP